MRELETGVISIIFPEGVKKHVQGDSSLFEMTKSILSIVSTGGLSLEEIKHELRLVDFLFTRCLYYYLNHVGFSLKQLKIIDK